MLETLAQIDLQIFRFIKTDCANAVTDLLMPQITSDLNLRIGYAAVMLILLWRGPKERRWQVVASILTLAASDLIASSVLKPLFDRPRPCQTLTDVHLLVNCGAGLSMPSSHAANAFAQFAFWRTKAPKMHWYLFAIAFLVAISRVFVGVHYPADVLVGAVLGLLVGSVISEVSGRIISRGKRGNAA